MIVGKNTAGNDNSIELLLDRVRRELLPSAIAEHFGDQIVIRRTLGHWLARCDCTAVKRRTSRAATKPRPEGYRSMCMARSSRVSRARFAAWRGVGRERLEHSGKAPADAQGQSS